MFEGKSEKVAHFDTFVKRMLICFGISCGILTVGLGIGVLGYHHFFGLAWVDALLNASMILGGMGPVDKAETDGAKLFASAYALFSGLVFIMAMGVTLSPLLHRILHKFHVDEPDLNK